MVAGFFYYNRHQALDHLVQCFAKAYGLWVDCDNLDGPIRTRPAYELTNYPFATVCYV